ncbi:MAG TPA: MFS transporter [Gaiellaceae bacterium]|nr:MFS transporter [Gaiellaceae bacterium]
MSRPGRLVTGPFVLAVAGTFGIFLSIGMLLPVLPVFAKGPLDAGNIGIGLAVAAASPTALLCQPVAGRLGDRRGRRLLVIAGPLIMGATIASYTLADSLLVLASLRLATGVGEAAAFVGFATIVNDLAPDDRRGETISLYSLGVWGGLAVGPLLGETILGRDRYDAVWLASAAFASASGLIAVALRETRPAAAVGERVGRTRIVHPAALAPGTVLIASAFGFAGFNAFVAVYARHLGLDGAGTIFLVYAAIVIAIRILGRTIPDRLGPRRASGLALCLLAAGLLTIGASGTATGLYAGTVLFACGTALAFPSLMTLAVDAAPESERSSVVGTFGAFADVGFALGAVSLGAVASVAGYRGVFVVGAFASLAGVALLVRLALAPRAAPAEAA